MQITNPNTTKPIVVERKVEDESDFAAVHDGESWFSIDGIEWLDGVFASADKKQVPMNACIKAFTLGDGTNPMSDDEKTIIGLPLVEYASRDSEYAIAISVKEAKTSDDNAPNESIPDEPSGTEIRYYLSNVTETHEYVEKYVSSNARLMGRLSVSSPITGISCLTFRT